MVNPAVDPVSESGLQVLPASARCGRLGAGLLRDSAFASRKGYEAVMKTISIVTPCRNEESNVDEIYNRVRGEMVKLGRYRYEHIFIDNSSRDNTVAILKRIASPRSQRQNHRQRPRFRADSVPSARIVSDPG